MLDGRVKTLHPKVHGGILARRDLPAHAAALASARHPADRPRRRQPLSVPRDGRAARLHARRRDREHRHRRPGDGARGGEELARTSASSSIRPTTRALLAELAANGSALSAATRFALARKAFSHTAAYDGAISNWLTARGPDGAAAAFPDRFNLQARKVQDLRYGENPHQQAAFYRDETPAPRDDRHVPAAAGQGAVVQQHRRRRRRVGMREDVRRRRRAACVIVKHANPCGVAIAATPLDAYRKAFATDPVSAFGGIIAFNRPVDAATLEAVSAQFLEVLIAPGYTDGRARGDRAEEERARARGRAAGGRRRRRSCDLKRVGGGLLRADRRRAQRRAVRAQGRDARRRRPPAQLARPAVRVARRQVRQVERDRLLRRRAHARHRRRADEPRRLDAHRRDQGRAAPACRSRARSSPPTRSSRSATASTSSPTTARSR